MTTPAEVRGTQRWEPPSGLPGSTRVRATLGPVSARVIAEVEERRQECGSALDPTRRAEFGQFFTPAPVAAFMAEMFEVRDRPVRLLDPGAGIGSLSAAVTARWRRDGGDRLDITAVEADPDLVAPLQQTMTDLDSLHDGSHEVVNDDFIRWGAEHVSGFGRLAAPKFDLVIMNPPYRKIHSASAERRTLSAAGIEVPNLYAGFVALATELLDDHGQLVAITPRSFTNGPYFRRFRKQLLDSVALRQIHVLDSRDIAFADSDVLQENVIIYAAKEGRRASVTVSSSRSVADAVSARAAPYEEVVRPSDPEAFIHITLDQNAADFARQVLDLPCTLPQLVAGVSTGPVVDFRVKEHLRRLPEPGTAPLVYPSHLRNGAVIWPQPAGKKANAIAITAATERLLMPAGVYVLVKRFTSKEERRRIVATVVSPDDLPGDVFGIENHLNVFHNAGQGLTERFARGLAAFLNTTTVDQFFRQFNGHTQVNATDLRNLRYPTLAELEELGERVQPGLDQIKLDLVAAEVLPTFSAEPLAWSA